MKLSNKIIAGFFGFILFYTFMVFAEIRIMGQSKVFEDDDSITETYPLEGLKYIIIQKDLNKRIAISSSSSPRIELKSLSGNFLPKMKYQLNNDTLFILAFDLEDNEEHFHFNIFVPKNGFKGLSTTESFISFTEIKQKSLFITQSGGQINMDNNISLEKLSIVSNENAMLDFRDGQADTVSLLVDDSEVRLYAKIHRLEGTLINDAAIYSSDISDIALKKDKGSSIRISD